MNTIVNERELDFADILKEGLNLFIFKFRDIALISLTVFVPLNFIVVFVAERLRSRSVQITISMILLLVFFVFLEAIISLIVTMSIAIIVEKTVDRKNIAAIDAVKNALSVWGTAILTNIHASLIILGLSLLLIIPGIIYSVYYVFAPFAVVLRGKSGKKALDYSKKLVQGQWWRVFGMLFGLGIIFAIFDGIITFVLSRISNNPYYSIVPGIVSLFFTSILTVFYVVLFLNNDYVFHRRLKKRAETARLRKTKKAPSFEQFIQKLEESKTRSSRRSTGKRTVHKSVKKTTSARRSSRTKK